MPAAAASAGLWPVLEMPSQEFRHAPTAIRLPSQALTDESAATATVTAARQVFEMEYQLPLFQRFGSSTSVDYLLCIYKVPPPRPPPPRSESSSVGGAGCTESRCFDRRSTGCRTWSRCDPTRMVTVWSRCVHGHGKIRRASRHIKRRRRRRPRTARKP